MTTKVFSFLFICFLSYNCQKAGASKTNETEVKSEVSEVEVGASQFDVYLPLIRDKRISLVVNQTSVIGEVHLVDTLHNLGMDIINIMSPEHGFRGDADAGAKIEDSRDAATNIPIRSLYGATHKPTPEMLEETEMVIFDIQDVGARFYTYISTLHYVMEACAELEIPVLILDRPNPNGHYVDGPIREAQYKSFVGMHEIPVVHGMTIGEYGQMINGESWLPDNLTCDLTVVPCKNYDHNTFYELPVPPSPNLPNIRSILLYPSLCFFEGTPLSIGRGTTTQFQVIGHPGIEDYTYTFTPTSMFGAAHPVLEDQECYGEDLTTIQAQDLHEQAALDLSYVLKYYALFPDKSTFFNENLWFDKLAGTANLRQDIVAGKSEEEIRASWQPGLDKFKETRAKYLLYR